MGNTSIPAIPNAPLYIKDKCVLAITAVFLQLFGPAQVTADNQTAPRFRSQKTVALLGYLVSQGRPVARERLAALFWPDAPEAKGELRRALHNLSTILPNCFAADRQTIHFVPTANCAVDVSQFAAFSRSDNSADWQTAVSLYRGDFLEGVWLDDLPELETWLLTSREQWRQQAVRLHQRLLQAQLAQADFAAAQQTTQSWLTLVPWEEAAHRHLMRLYWQTGQPIAALQQFRLCQTLLRQELAVDPSPETVDLYQRLQTAVSRPRHNLPTPASTFVGRESDLTALQQRLADPGCRLLTITGSGGVGKTRLSLALAHSQVAHFLEGVAFVSLAELEETAVSEAALIAHFCDVLAIPTHEDEPLREQLLAYLRPRELLLLLDNAETGLHQGLQPLLSTLLAAAPTVKLVLTSREALHLPGEWRYPLLGLAYPTAATPTEPVANYAAVALFAERARQMVPEFDVLEEQTAVVRICQLVEGLPLGLELAAVWVKLLSCADIAAEIAANSAILATNQTTLPLRHRSLEAVWRTSWQRLPTGAQQLLARLSRFQGSFSREAAQQVAEATLPLLGQLLDASLLRQEQTETAVRYHIHPLLRQFATAQRLADPAFDDRYLHFYATLLEKWAEALYTVQREVAWVALQPELENVRAMWAMAVAQQRWARLAQALAGWHRLLALRGLFEEGVESLAAAAAALAAVPDQVALRCRLLVRLGWHSGRLGRYDQAEAAARDCLALAQGEALAGERPFAHFVLGLVAFGRGQLHEAQAAYEAALAGWRTQHDGWGTAVTLLNLGQVQQRLGQYEQAGGPYEEGLALYQATGYAFGATTAVASLSRFARSLGNYTRAQQLWQQSLAAAREREDPWGVAAALDNLGSVGLSMGKLDEAEASFAASLAIRRQLADERGAAAVLDNLSRVALAAGAHEQARWHSEKSVALWRKLGERRGTAVSLVQLGQVEQEAAAWSLARAAYQTALYLYRELGDGLGTVVALLGLGYTAIGAADETLADSYLRQVLALSEELGAWPLLLDGLLGWALLHQPQAATLLALIEQHPAYHEGLRARRERLLPTITAVSDPELLRLMERVGWKTAVWQLLGWGQI